MIDNLSDIRALCLRECPFCGNIPCIEQIGKNKLCLKCSCGILKRQLGTLGKRRGTLARIQYIKPIAMIWRTKETDWKKDITSRCRN